MIGNDRFEISNFRKASCKSMETRSGYRCAFAANIILANGPMQRSLVGRFYNSSEGIKFSFETEFQGDPVPTLMAERQ